MLTGLDFVENDSDRALALVRSDGVKLAAVWSGELGYEVDQYGSLPFYGASLGANLCELDLYESYVSEMGVPIIEGVSAAWSSCNWVEGSGVTGTFKIEVNGTPFATVEVQDYESPGLALSDFTISPIPFPD